MTNMDGNQADEVEVFEMFGGDLPVMHQSRESDCGKWMGDCPHNVPMGAGVEFKTKMNVRVEHSSAWTGK
ncbi:MAG: hypothetical protein IKE29_05400 [Paenibacillus sp.]|uniref:hypothetical protein n=1 Tax=Paenibacillus sp. TaxID=58172 RepID=UPI0025E52A8E|nr:hypothetical protein [Paenibacillus sp.]MBR2564042.1 hypothetical protein [Paenibacillus sp.]